MKKMLIINPPDFTRFIYEKNLFCTDGLVVINTLLKDYPNIISKTIDFDFDKLGINDLFSEVRNYNPDFVYLNLNSYNYCSNFHLCIGIKKNCPKCKIIVGYNISERIKLNLNKEILDNIDYWLDYDLNTLKIDSDIISKVKIFSNKAYKILYFQNKSLEEILNEINSNLNNKITSFVFRNASLSFEDLKYICCNANKHFKFILENDNLSISQINFLHRKYGLKGIILDLNKNPYSVSLVKKTNVFPFARMSLNNENRKMYDCMKNYNIFFLDLIDDVEVDISDFKKHRYKELSDFYLSYENIKNNFWYFFKHPLIFHKYSKFRDYLIKYKRNFY